MGDFFLKNGEIKMASDKQEVARYLWFVLKGDGSVWTGYEDRNDAKEDLKELKETDKKATMVAREKVDPATLAKFFKNCGVPQSMLNKGYRDAKQDAKLSRSDPWAYEAKKDKEWKKEKEKAAKKAAMSFVQKVESQYKIVAKKTPIANDLLKLASDLGDLNYTDEQQQQLLDILKKAYESVQAGCVTADVAWDKIIKENKKKQLKRKEQMKKENKDALEKSKKRGNQEMTGLEKKIMKKLSPEEKQISTNIEKIGNLVKVNFGAAKDQKLAKEKSSADFAERTMRMRRSVEKINSLMQELRRSKQAENKPTLKSV